MLRAICLFPVMGVIDCREASYRGRENGPSRYSSDHPECTRFLVFSFFFQLSTPRFFYAQIYRLARLFVVFRRLKTIVLHGEWPCVGLGDFYSKLQLH